MEKVCIDAEPENLPLEGNGIVVTGIVEMPQKKGIEVLPKIEAAFGNGFEEVLADEDLNRIVGRDDEIVSFAAGGFEFDDELFVRGVVIELHLDAGLFSEGLDDFWIEDIAPSEDGDAIRLELAPFEAGPIEDGDEKDEPEENDTGAEEDLVHQKILVRVLRVKKSQTSPLLRRRRKAERAFTTGEISERSIERI